MKILYHHRTASSDGQAVHIEELISALIECGHEVKIVAPTPISGNEMGKQVSWVQNLKLILPQLVYELMELLYSCVSYFRLRKAILEFNPDLLYERYNLFMVAGVFIHKKYKVPYFVEVNSPLVEERSLNGGLGLPGLARWSEQLVWREADFVLPVTEVLAGYVLTSGVPKSRIKVIPNGINLAHFSTAPDTEVAKINIGLSGCIVLGFTGFVRDWHGVDKVIKWIASGRAPINAHLLIVGDGPARRGLEFLADQLNLSSRITFTGVISRTLVPSYVAAFDIALQPAVVSYASPLKLFEYLALGKAIIAPNTPNIREILQHDINSCLFSDNLEGDFENSLDVLCNNASLRVRLGKAARETVDSLELTWYGNVKKLSELYSTVHVSDKKY